MPRGRNARYKIVLSGNERQELEHITRSTSLPAGMVRRARIALLSAD